jgi:electron transfer flavoprotein alpha subunit
MMSDELSAQDFMAAFGISLEEEAAGEYRGVMTVAEAADGVVAESSLGALGLAREIADAFGARLEVLLLGGTEESAQALIRRGADVVLLADTPSAYEAATWSAAIASAVEARKPEVALFGGSDVARDVAPRVAQQLATGLIAGAGQVRAEADERVVVGTVALFGGRLLGEFACPDKRPQMILLADGAGRIPSEDASRQGEVERLAG